MALNERQCARWWPVRKLQPQEKAKIPRVRCANITVGRNQICGDCRARDLLCQFCDQPHGGKPRLTRYCDRCRSLFRRKPRSPRNPPWTEEEDKLLLETYENYNDRQITHRLIQLFPTRPKWSLKRRAIYLGIATVRKKEPMWTPEEDALLAKFGWMCHDKIVQRLKEAGFKRTVNGVAVRMKRLGTRASLDSYTAQGLARLMGVDVHRVMDWIKGNLLEAEHSGKGNGVANHDKFHITTAAIRNFFFRHSDQVNLLKLERAGSRGWFFEIITGGIVPSGGTVPAELKIPEDGLLASSSMGVPAAERVVPMFGEKMTLAALADICGRTIAQLQHRIDELGLSVHDAAFGQDPNESHRTEPDPSDAELAEQLSTWMGKMRCSTPALSKKTGLSESFVLKLRSGEVPLVLPAFSNVLEKLGARLQVVPDTPTG